MHLINSEEWLSEPRIVAGVMTGTSLDGIDIAFVKFWQGERGHCFEIQAYSTFPFSIEVKDFIKKIINEPIEIQELSLLNAMLPELFADAIISLAEKSKFPVNKLDAVGIHGQTLWHEPVGRQFQGIKYRSTLQIASTAILAQQLNLPVIGDFRTADLALGGQAAPLVPIFDYEFLRSDKQNRIILNIGGIANLTYLPAGSTSSQVRAFDTGPGNCLLDTFARKYFNIDYDENGRIAASAAIHQELLDALKRNDFISKIPPKSTGRELFNEKLIQKVLADNTIVCENAELLRTLTEFTAWSITENIRKFTDEHSTVLVSGGGAENSFLMQRVSENLTDALFIKSDDIGLPSSAKEAVCFAFLAYLNLARLPGNLPSVTGASRQAILGVLSIP